MGNTRIISSLDLRYHLPEIRLGLKSGIRYILLYHGEPIGELLPTSETTSDMFFEGDLDQTRPKTPAGKRIVENVVKRKRMRMRRNKK